jgi:hypothetical protein
VDSNQSELLVQRLFEVLNDGKREATYKLALLLALIDWATTHPGQNKVPTRDLAEIVLGLYFPQVSPYTDVSGSTVTLKQGQQKSVLIPKEVAALRTAHPKARRPEHIAKADTKAYTKTLTEVERVLVSQPIPRLQRVGNQNLPFLYSCTWKEKQSLGPLRKAEADFVLLHDGVPERLVALGSLVRSVIERLWVVDVAAATGLETEEEKLVDHLFGKERTTFPSKIREGLRALHKNKCFYCSCSLSGTPPIDHFIPWSRFPNDAIENLVMSCKTCNSRKSDHLASGVFVQPWLTRLDEPALTEIALATGWESNPTRARAIAESIYGSVAVDSILWNGGASFNVLVEEDLATLGSLFG